jgi:hypothetical protein
MSVIGDEPDITDDNTGDKRELKLDCIKFWINSTTTKNKGDNFTLSNGKLTFFTAKSDKTKLGFTTFSSVSPIRTNSINIVLEQIISGSYEYDGETESFDIPMTLIIYSNDNITCKLSNKTSNKNSLTYDSNQGVIKISRTI